VLADAVADALRGCAAAGEWTRTKAREWWDDHRELIESHRATREGPGVVTVVTLA